MAKTPKIVAETEAPIDWNNVDETNVEYLPAGGSLSVQQAKEVIYRTDWKDVMAIGWDDDGDFKIRSSKVSRQAAVYLAHMLIDHVMKGD